jgi:hypothetical protein
MTISNLGILEPGEAAMAKILVRNNFVPQETIDQFVALKQTLITSGKPVLGGILIALGYITDKDLEDFINENEGQHIAFVDTLLDRGFLTAAQRETLLEEHAETKQNIATLVSKKNIMTKEFYNKLFNNQGFSLKLGEWLIANKKVDQRRLDEALKLHNITTLEKFLIVHNHVDEQVLNKIKGKINHAQILKA